MIGRSDIEAVKWDEREWGREGPAQTPANVGKEHPGLHGDMERDLGYQKPQYLYNFLRVPGKDDT
jgi:hypothetical protein